MSRSLHAFILLAVLLWQSWVTVGGVSVLSQAGGPAPAMELVGHSALGLDIAPQMDADEAPAPQLHVDGGSGGHELLASVWRSCFSGNAIGIPEFVGGLWRSAPVFLFLRPPRAWA